MCLLFCVQEDVSYCNSAAAPRRTAVFFYIAVLSVSVAPIKRGLAAQQILYSIYILSRDKVTFVLFPCVYPARYTYCSELLLAAGALAQPGL